MQACAAVQRRPRRPGAAAPHPLPSALLLLASLAATSASFPDVFLSPG